MPTLTPAASHLRLIAICFVAASVSLPMAWISLGKLVLFATYLVSLLHPSRQSSAAKTLAELWSARLSLMALALFGLSMLWTAAPPDIALQAFVKHAKLLEIFMMVALIRNIAEARVVLRVYLAAQCFFIASSWIMAAGFRVPWASSLLVPEYQSVVYSTYLDQTLIFAASAAVLWHLRHGVHPSPVTGISTAVFAALALTNNLALQLGRTGYLASFAVMTFGVAWALPKKWRVAALLLFPAVISLGLYSGSGKFQGRVNQVFTESQSFATQGNDASSSGFRLNVWRRSLQAMQEQPVTGHGVGSWTLTVKRLEGAHADAIFGTAVTSNPHQEFLLWGVELGVIGTLLLMAWIVSLAWDSRQFEPPMRQAVWSVLAVMVVGCLFNSSLFDALIGDYFCITLGLLLAFGVHHRAAAQASLKSPTEPEHP